MRQELAPYIPCAQAIERLLYPFAEVVIHDLESGTVAAIFNNFSKRKVGDESCLDANENFDAADAFGPYYKTNWNGKKIKSSTAVLKDAKGKNIGLLCINLEVHDLDIVHKALAAFIGHNETKGLPAELFSEDWREKISIFVTNELKEQGKSLAGLTRDERRELVLKLHKEGAFNAPHAASFVADILDISRATVYKYLAD